MAANETALIVVQPDDSTDTVLEKMLRSGAASVQMLVPDGAIGLRTVAQTNRLRQMAEWSWIDLTLVSSDPATIGAAWISQIQLLVVCDTQVVATVPHALPDNSGDEQPVTRDQAPPAAAPHARTAPPPAPRQRTDRHPPRSGAAPRHAVPRLKRREPSRPRPRRSGGHTR